ncbi:MAG: 50S ribosomal protein L30 [Bacillota bacterium]
MATKLQITLVRSPVSCRPKQRQTLKALGLQKIGQRVEHSDVPEIRGMIRVVDFLVNVEESK